MVEYRQIPAVVEAVQWLGVDDVPSTLALKQLLWKNGIGGYSIRMEPKWFYFMQLHGTKYIEEPVPEGAFVAFENGKFRVVPEYLFHKQFEFCENDK